jgi:membrane associated rhomboid family serine protease
MFFILPVAVDHPMRRWPVLTFILLGINTLIYLLSLLFFFSNPEETDPLIVSGGVIPAHWTFWSLLTHQFVHAGFFHFVGNMIYLYLFGACIEDLFGRVGFPIFFVAGGVAAALAQVMFTTSLQDEIPIVGASGAISACLGAFVVALPKTRINLRYFGWILRPFGGDFWLPAWVVISFWFGCDLLSLLADLGGETGTGGVAFAAHIGGTLAGAGFMWAIRGRVLGSVEDEAPQKPTRAEREVPHKGDPAEIYLLVGGNQAGPYALTQVRAMAGLGSLPPDACFWRNGMEEWRPLDELGEGRGGGS